MSSNSDSQVKVMTITVTAWARATKGRAARFLLTIHKFVGLLGRGLIRSEYQSVANLSSRSKSNWGPSILSEMQDYGEYLATSSYRHESGGAVSHLFRRRYVLEIEGVDFFPSSGVLALGGVGIQESTPWNPEKRFLSTHRLLPRVTNRDCRPLVPLGQTNWNYYHFLIEDLPYVLRGSYHNPKVAVLLSVDAPVFVREFLDVLGIEFVLVWRPTRIQSIVFPTRGNDTGWPHRQDIALLRQRFRAGRVSASSNKLYVSRRFSGRSPADEKHLEDLLRSDFGFNVIFPEKMSASDQVAAFQSAGIIVGPHGAGLSNTVFANPGSSVIEIASEDNANPCFEILAQECDFQYTRIVLSRASFNAGFSETDYGLLSQKVREACEALESRPFLDEES